MVEKPNPFYKLQKVEVPINNSSELTQIFDTLNKDLSDVCELALKQHIPRKQRVSMTGASFRNARYTLTVEDNPDQRSQSKRKS